MPKVAKDFYPTPYEAVLPLLQHMDDGTLFVEPCGGDYALAGHLERHGHKCHWAGDTAPQHHKVKYQDAMLIHSTGASCFITNPPYTWAVLSPLITHLSDLAPTWLLLPADMMHNKRMAPHMYNCSIIQSVGRVKWFNNKAGMENSAWYLFDSATGGPATFYGR
tara:strand:+ start:605 stop:1096 length:492 start_codon:yes stop_codon:yes gene_type:complete